MTTYSLVADDLPTSNPQNIYGRTDDDGLMRVTCSDKNPEFQQWLRDNQDNLPADIQAKVEAGELTIQDADS